MVPQCAHTLCRRGEHEQQIGVPAATKLHGLRRSQTWQMATGPL
jgi:hypothetical protein